MKAKQFALISLVAALLMVTAACGGGPAPAYEHGTYLLYEIDYTYVDPVDQVDARGDMVSVLRQRLSPYVIAPEVGLPDADHLYLFLPDVMSIDDARDMVGNTEQLTLREQVDNEWVVAYAEGTDGRTRAFTGAFIQGVSWDPHSLQPPYTATVYIDLNDNGRYMMDQIGGRNWHKDIRLYIGDEQLLAIYITQAYHASISVGTLTSGDAELAAERIEGAAIPVSLIYVEGQVYP